MIYGLYHMAVVVILKVAARVISASKQMAVPRSLLKEQVAKLVLVLVVLLALLMLMALLLLMV